MNALIKAAVMGCGHIGAQAVNAVRLAPDMELVGILEVEAKLAGVMQAYPGVPASASVTDLPSRPDVVILAVPTRAVEGLALPLLEQGIHTVDCFDMHGEPFNRLRASLDPAARQHNCAAVMCSGVDPGVSTMVRALFEIWAPTGLTYVNYGPGMSMGHSVAARSVPGVRDALAITRPGDPGVHKREVYVELENGADLEEIRRTILADPYFASDEVRIFQVEDVASMVDTGHRIEVFRKGGSSGVDNQLLNFTTTFNNPASTAQIMAASARAATRLTPGAHTMLEIPLLDFLPGDREVLRKRLV